MTHLPAAIRTRDDDNISGDSNYDLVLERLDEPAGAAQVARSLSYRINNIEVARLNYSAVTPNPTIPADAFAVPACGQGGRQTAGHRERARINGCCAGCT